MYNVSSATLAAIENFNLQARITGTVNGVAFTDANIVGGSFSINNQCSSDTELTIGNVYVGELNITLTGLSLDRYSLYGKLIIPTYGLYVDNAWVSIPLGEYIISEVEVTNVGIDIRAYDNMSKFDVPFELVSLSGTAYALASAACTACGLTLATTQTQFNAFTNHGVTFTATQTDGKIPQFSTYRDVISAVAQVSCCNVLIDRSGQVVFTPYPSTAVATIDTSHRMMGGMTADFETYYDSILWTDPSTKEQTKYTRSNPSGLTMDLGDNPLINTEAIRTAILNGLTFRFHPFRMNILNAPLYDLMDCIYLPDGVGDGTKLYCITKYNWTYHGSYQLVGAGQDPKLVSVASSAQRTAQQAAQIAAQKVSSDEMDAAIDSATAQITGNNGGYVVLHDSDNDDQPDELLIMNTPSIDTATKVWRWNQSGLGYSSTGYSGTYGLAMTANGAIVADYITTGTLNANLLKAGIIEDLTGDNYWNLETGELSLNVTGTVQSITTYYAESYTNEAPQWDYPTAYLYDSAGQELLDSAGQQLIARRGWNTTPLTSISDAYRWMRNYIEYKDGTTELTSAAPMQDYYGRANLVVKAGTDSDGNPIGVLSGLADYMKFTAGQLEVSSSGFSLDRYGNARFAGDVVAKSLTLDSGVTIPYSKVSERPDLTVYIQKDGTIGSTPAEGATGFRVSSEGLLTASNAVIYGSVYASSLVLSGSATIGVNKISGLQDNTTDLINSTVDKAFVDELGVEAGTVRAENIIGTTISGKTIVGGIIKYDNNNYWNLETGEIKISSFANQFSSLQSSIDSTQAAVDALEIGIAVDNNGVTVGRQNAAVKGVFSNDSLEFQTMDGTPIAWLSSDASDGLGVDLIQIGSHTTVSQRWIIKTDQNGARLTFTRRAS